MRLAPFRALVATVLSLWLATSALAGWDEGDAAYEHGDYVAALEIWLPLAIEGDARSQYSLGFMYRKGLGVSQDYTEAARWYRESAEQGTPLAQYNLAYMLDTGLGVPQN